MKTATIKVLGEWNALALFDCYASRGVTLRHMRGAWWHVSINVRDPSTPELVLTHARALFPRVRMHLARE